MTKREGEDKMIECERARKNGWRGGVEGLHMRLGGRWREMISPRVVFPMQDETPEEIIRGGRSGNMRTRQRDALHGRLCK